MPSTRSMRSFSSACRILFCCFFLTWFCYYAEQSPAATHSLHQHLPSTSTTTTTLSGGATSVQREELLQASSSLPSSRPSEPESLSSSSVQLSPIGTGLLERSGSTTSTSSSSSIHSSTLPREEEIRVRKRNGKSELFDSKKLLQRLTNLSQGLDSRFLDLESLTASISRGMYPNVTALEIDTLAAESAASLSTQHPDYATLALRIVMTLTHKITPATFSEAVQRAYNHGKGFIHPHIASLVQRRAKEIDERIVHQRDYTLTYFGFKTLEKSYLIKTDDEEDQLLLERPQYLMMRVALGIHCSNPKDGLTEDQRLQAAFETYDMMSRGLFTHASPTLFHSGTTHPQLSSCFLVQMSEDSINGIYDTLKRCAVISKAAGGIGMSVHNIRARGTAIRGTRGVSNGLVPMLRVYDVTSRYVDQGGGKRPGAFAVYIEPWHADIFDVLHLKKNHGKEEQRARDLFYGLWIPNLFMKRVEEDQVWSLMCPHQCPGLSECYGQEYEELYEKYESEGKFVRQVRARELWSAILESQIESGGPYMLFKDYCNEKSNQKNLGTIQCSNLCTEIIQYTDAEEVAVCNLASICIPKFVISDREVGSQASISGRAYFDHEKLHKVAKVVTKNLNKIIDINSYPVDGSKTSNMRHRPIGMGVSGLADAFVRLGLPFTSPEAKQLNKAIFETLYHAALEASAELAEEEGPYETFAGSPTSEGILQFHMWGKEAEDLPSSRFCRGLEDEHINQHYAPKYQKTGYDWNSLRERIKQKGLRNSLLLAPMPTASTSQILGVNECFEPFSSNLYIRRVKAGEFIMANPHLMKDLTDRGLWTPSVRNQMMRDGGSVQNIAEIPDRLKDIYKTVWEIKMKDIIDMAADRGMFVDQSQSLNLFMADPTIDRLTAMHFYAWRKGLKTGMYYLRTKPAVNAIQYTVDRSPVLPNMDSQDVCISCSA